ncbi:MAG: hypothetical protein NZ811_05425 [Gammaproteobacteria bacterium]|nr:hypothetical protein [Gammaproteobacteria bacterium]
MKLITTLMVAVFLSGCLVLDVVRKPGVEPRNTGLDKPPKVYLTMEQMKRMSDAEIREFFDITN